jgi:NACalpha-BTF3-like transcription factor
MGDPEVIVNFSDGFAYSKGRMDEAFRSGIFDKQQPTKSTKETAVAKREDVDLIVHELEIPRAQAEKALIENGGDLAQTLRALITP